MGTDDLSITTNNREKVPVYEIISWQKQQKDHIMLIQALHWQKHLQKLDICHSIRTGQNSHLGQCLVAGEKGTYLKQAKVNRSWTDLSSWLNYLRHWQTRGSDCSYSKICVLEEDEEHYIKTETVEATSSCLPDWLRRS